MALPVGDHPLVGGLGVLGDLPLGCASLLAVRRAVGAGGRAAGVAGFELDRADLPGHCGREAVGVVLFADEEAPEQAGNLAGERAIAIGWPRRARTRR